MYIERDGVVESTIKPVKVTLKEASQMTETEIKFNRSMGLLDFSDKEIENYKS